MLSPPNTVSLKEVFIERFAHLILGDSLRPGERLPSERTLSQQLGVSRPVVHDGLVELSAAGLVTIKPRVGTVVNDYRCEGSLQLLNTLVRYAGNALSPELSIRLVEARRPFEAETARLCAQLRTEAEISALEGILAAEERADPTDLERIVELDYQFHHRIALASRNPFYPMLLRSFGEANRILAKRYFADRRVIPPVLGAHRLIIDRIEAQDPRGASNAMVALLDLAKAVMERWEPNEGGVKH